MSIHSFDYFKLEKRKLDASKIELSEDQQTVYDKMFDWYQSAWTGSGLLTVGGFAGSGKSTLLAKLINDVGSNHFSCATYTGKAANVLAQKLNGSTVTTIHGLIYRPFEKPDGTITFKRRYEEETDIKSIIVIDEASMVDENVFEDIKSFGTPILAIGDHGQLPPISGPSVLMRDPMLRLEKIHRQAEGSPIIQLSKTIRETGRVPIPTPKGIRLLSMGMFEAEMRERVPSMSVEDLMDMVVLCYKNMTRVRINRVIREARYGMGVQDDHPLQGDVVVCLRNQPPIYNGMRGVLQSVEKMKGPTDRLKTVFPDDGIIHTGPVVRAQFGRETTFSNVNELRAIGIKHVARDVRELGAFYDYGYCMTVHKAQGSGFKTVYWIRERSRADDDTYQRWMYTAVTRAIDELVVVAA